VGVLVVASSDAPKIFEPSEHAFDDIAVAIAFFIEGMDVLRLALLGMTGLILRRFSHERQWSASYHRPRQLAQQGLGMTLAALATEVSR